MPAAAKKEANEVILDIINSSIRETRVISEFEKTRIEKLLDGMYKSGDYRYYALASCYYSQISDIDNLLFCVDKAINSGFYSDIELPNIILSLSNAFRFKEVFYYIKEGKIAPLKHDAYMRNCIRAITYHEDETLLNEYSKFYIEWAKGDERAKMFSEESKSVFSFLKRADSQDRHISKYILDSLDLFSRKIMPLCDPRWGDHYLKYEIFEYNDKPFMGLTLALQSTDFQEEFIEMVADVEDEFLYTISGLECPPEYRGFVSFNIEVEELSQ